MKTKSVYISIMMLSGFMVCGQPHIQAQETVRKSKIGNGYSETRESKAWEIGIGAAGLQMTRFGVVGFYKNAEGGYNVETSKKDALFGGQLYAARELNGHFYLDMQGEVQYARDPVYGGRESRWIGMAGLGLQWRLGEYFRSPYIDPFLRAGVSYMYKNFSVAYNGIKKFDGEEMDWNFTNDYNKDGADRKHLVPISLGAGVNMWLNDRLGLGLQAEYLLMPYKQVANAWQGSVRLMWRIGGKSKKPKPEIQYMERTVEKIVEKPVMIEKVIEKTIPGRDLWELFDDISFDFGKWTITTESMAVIDEIAMLMKDNGSRKFLITGCTDAKGSPEYNHKLSEKRAAAVVDALVKKGVPASALKSRGVGKKISYASETASDRVRRGDRKIIVEVVTNMDYWNYIP